MNHRLVLVLGLGLAVLLAVLSVPALARAAQRNAFASAVTALPPEAARVSEVCAPAALVPAPRRASCADARECYLQGTRLNLEGNWAEAARLLNSTSYIHATLSAYEYGKALWCGGNVEQALTAWAKDRVTLQQHMLLMSKITYAAGQTQAAGDWFQLVQLFTPGDAHAIALGSLYEKKGDWTNALQAYARGADEPDAKANLLFLAANAAYQLKQFDTAQAYAQRAVALAPDDWHNWQVLGGALLGQSRWTEAESAFRRALATRPDYSPANAGVASALVYQGRIDEARPFYEAASRYAGSVTQQAAYLIEYAVTLDNGGEHGAALDFFARAAAIAPNDWLNHTYYANALMQSEALGEAEAEYRRAIALNPAYPYSNAGLANALVQQGKLTEARPFFEAAVELVDTDEQKAGYLTAYATALDIAGDHVVALEYWSRAAATLPNDSLSHLHYGNALLAQQEWSQAMSEFHRALALNPADASARAGLGSALVSQGKLAEARPYFEAAVQFAASDTEKAGYLVAYATALDAAGDHVAARDWISRAAALDPQDDNNIRFLQNEYVTLGDCAGLQTAYAHVTALRRSIGLDVPPLLPCP